MPPKARKGPALERCWLTSVTLSRSRHARPVLGVGVVGGEDRMTLLYAVHEVFTGVRGR